MLLADEGVRMRVVGLRWLMPLPVDDVVRGAGATGRVLVVDETKHGCGVGERIVTARVEDGFGCWIIRVASHNSYPPQVAPRTPCCLARRHRARGPQAVGLTDRPIVCWLARAQGAEQPVRLLVRTGAEPD